METLCANMIEKESQDWYQAKPPETDNEGFFQTTLPIILFQMLDQYLKVGQFIKQRVRLKILGEFKPLFSHMCVFFYCLHQPQCEGPRHASNLKACRENKKSLNRTTIPLTKLTYPGYITLIR